MIAAAKKADEQKKRCTTEQMLRLLAVLPDLERGKLIFLDKIAIAIDELEYRAELDTLKRNFIFTGEWTGRAVAPGCYVVTTDSIFDWVERGAA